MHECLLLPEILHIILEFLQDKSNTRSSREHLVNFAVTCKALSDPVLDFLWRSVTNFRPLIQFCLPSDVADQLGGNTSGRPSITLDRETEPSEFSRFEYYASKIRHVKYTPSSKRVYASLAAVQAYYCPKQPLFPRIMSLQFSCMEDNNYRIFITPSLREVTIGWDTEQEQTVQVLMELLRIPIQLEILNMGDPRGLDMCPSPELSSLVDKIGMELRTLVCGRRMLTINTLINLSRFPHLTKLHLCNSSGDMLAASNQRNAYFFPALEDLSLHVSAFENLIPILSTLSSRQLVSLVIVYIVEAGIPELYTLNSCFEELRKRASPAFTLLRISQQRLATVNEHRSSMIVTFSTLQPLLQLHSLQTLELFIHCRFDIDDVDLKSMATSWPALRALQFGGGLGWGRPSGISLEGLLPLFKGCPEIEKLGVVLNTNLPLPTEEAINSISNEQVNHHITYLQLGNSSVNSMQVDTVAKFLAKCLPKLNGIGGEWLFRTLDGLDQSDRRWDAVLQKVRNIRKSEQIP